jgi:hypothetical protein
MWAMSDAITSSTAPNKGGRPRNPVPPKNAADVRLLVGQEVVKTKPRRLRALQKLLKSFEDAEKQAALDRQSQLQQEANELSRLEYQRRQQTGALLLASRKEPKIIESLTEKLAEQDARIRSLTQDLERLTHEKALLQQSADTLAGLKAEAASEVEQILGSKLEAEYKELTEAPVTEEIIRRMEAVLLQLNIVRGRAKNPE